MSVTKNEISRWVKTAPKGSTHVLIVTDTFDYGSYPVYVNSVDAARKTYSEPGSMQRVMEVYSLALPIEAQLNEDRAFHF